MKTTIKYLKPLLILLVLCFYTELLAQYDLYGLWARKTGLLSANSGVAVKQMLTDKKGNTYVCGTFYGIVGLSDNSCVSQKAAGYPYSSGFYSGSERLKSDGVIIKYDKTGNWLWTITLQSEISDYIESMVLSEDEESLLFIAQYASQADISSASKTFQSITYGDGTTEAIPYTNYSNVAAYNIAMVSVKVVDGSKQFFQYMPINMSLKYRLQKLRTVGDKIHAYGAQLASGIYYANTWEYDVSGNLLNTYTQNLNASLSYTQIFFTTFTDRVLPSKDTYGVLSVTESSNQYVNHVAKISPTGAISYLSKISTTNWGGNYGIYGITDPKVDVNDAETHLFLTGKTVMNFNYVSKPQSIVNAGGEDGIIICYDPQNTNEATNMRWMVNLRAAGNQRVWDCKFDDITNTLKVVGAIDQNPVDFNPNGIAMTYKATHEKAIFYAVYDMNGKCLHVDIIDSKGDDEAQALGITANTITIFGNFGGSPFQADPSDRLIAMRTAMASTFLAKYSTNPSSVPEPLQPGSFSTADNIKGNYGMAYHDVMSCIALGTINKKIDMYEAYTYVPKYNPTGTANPNYDGLTNFRVNVPAGGFTATVKATNNKVSSAYLAAWIDFDGNGVLDSTEVSNIVSVPANAVNGTYDLVWPTPPVVTKLSQETYMRIRLTTEELNGTWAAGNAADGEVEDYAVTLNLLELAKTATSSNAIPTTADVGDTITYNINLTNNITGDVFVFDPIPEGTTFIDATPAGTLNNVPFEGSPVQSITWPNAGLVAGANPAFSFRVLVTSKPANADSIYNIAFAVMHGDTISSADGSCNVAGIEINKIRAVNDTVSTLKNTPVTVPVLDNDYYLPTCTPVLSVVIDGTKGTASVNVSGDSIIYTPNPTALGRDSITYKIDCGGGVDSTAKVYVMINSKPDNIVDSADCFVPAPSFDFKIKQKWITPSGEAHRMSSTIVGDLDGDGVAEVAVYGNVDNGNNFINIFDGSSQVRKAQIAIPTIHQPQGWRPAMIAAMVDADANGLGEIIVARSDLKIMSYEADTTGGTFTMVEKWPASATYTSPTTDKLPHPNIADLNNDGIPELIIFNQVYNAVTGAYLGQTEPIATAYFGRIPLQHNNRASNFQSVADIDGDGLLEIIAGGKIYKPIFNATKTAVTFDIMYENTTIGDGFTSVADVDLDGKLDVVVAKATSASATHLYIWSPLTNRMIDDFQIANAGGYNGVSFPFIGDIDGETDALTNKKYPEICVNSVYKVFAYKYNSATGKYGTKWELTTSDQSGATGITLFDFNNDGTAELVYRDQSSVRILDGSGPAPVLADPGATFSCGSSTSFEYPSIVDIDGDGSANICVTCDPYLIVFESGSKPWAPTRKVWNQVNYDPTLINDDLTVPLYPIAKNTEFKGKHPYNGALIQVPTMVDGSFNIVMLAPDPSVDALWTEQISQTTVRIWLRIKNLGVNNTNAGLPVALYGVNPPPATPDGSHIAIKPVGVVIAPNKSYDMYFDVPVTSLTEGMSVRIQDDGIGYPADGSYLDCDYSNNVMGLNTLILVDDNVVVFENSINNSIKMLENDVFSESCTSSFNIIQPPAHGFHTVIGDTIVNYTPYAGYLGPDTIKYTITCNSVTDTASIFITVISNGSEVVDPDCVDSVTVSNFTMERYAQEATTISNRFPLIAGDLDGDGLPELLSLVTSSAQWVSPYTSYMGNVVRVHMSDGTVKDITLQNNFAISGTLTIGRIKTEDGYKSLIFGAERPGYLLAFDLDGNLYWNKYRATGRSDVMYRTTYNGYEYAQQALGIADLDGDGYSELYINNKVFDAATGKLICTTSSTNQGFSYSHNSTSPYIIYNSVVSVADVDNDGKMELLVGNEAWRVNIDRTAPYNPTGTMSLYSSVTPPAGMFPDGHTQVLDFDGDGYTDVLVTLKTYPIATQKDIHLYVWSPKKGEVIASKVITNASGNVGKSFPSIGDINGDGKPEILILGQTNIYAFAYDGTTTMKQLWTFPHGDDTHAVGLTLFDFNSDGTDEIAYRNNAHLRILDGSGATPVVLSSAACASGTEIEYPLVVDLDGDGSAEMVIVGNSQLEKYRPTVGRWASARPVWNQYAYNGLNINDDLTTRVHPPTPATILPGADGITGTADDRQPYNGYQRQLATISPDGELLKILPNAEIGNNPDLNYNVVSDVLRITLKVYNKGNLGFKSPFKVTVYNTTASKKLTVSHNEIIRGNDSATIIIEIPDFKAQWQPYKDILVRVNDNGDGYNDQPVCDSANREYKFKSIIAIDDYVSVPGKEYSILVKRNDLIPASCAGVIPNVISGPQHGTITMRNDTIVYSSATFNRYDTLVYTISCGVEIDTATVYMRRSKLPDNFFESDCNFEPDSIKFDMKLRHQSVASLNVANRTSVTVGDLDGDGYSEIIAIASGNATVFNLANRYAMTNKFYILDHEAQLIETVTLAGDYLSAFHNSIILADLDNDGKAEIIVPTNGNGGTVKPTLRVFKYDKTGSPKVTQVAAITSNTYFVNTVGVADFNNDGYPEIYAGTSIYRFENNNLILLHEGNAYRHAAAQDIDNDGTPELIIPEASYKVSLTNMSGTAGNTLTKIASPVDPYIPNDCTSLSYWGNMIALSDIDLDGQIEVVLVIPREMGTHIMLRIWDPITGIIKYNIDVPVPGTGGSVVNSIPFIGDTDGDGYPDIAFMGGRTGTTTTNIFRYAYDKATGTVIQKYKSANGQFIDGSSACTGMSMFDFNMDGKMEIVYRDEVNLYILNGANFSKLHTEPNNTSATRLEYPVVASLTPSGESFIIINSGTGTQAAAGTVRIYGSKSSVWAPARKTWNQFSFYQNTVTDDLKVIDYPAPLNQEFYVGGKTLYPLNGHLMQLGPLEENTLKLVYPTPDLDMDVLNYWHSNDTLYVNIKVENKGDAGADAPIPVTVYKYYEGNKTVMYDRDSVRVDILPGNTVSHTVVIPGISQYRPIDSLFIVVNEFNPDCDTTNNGMYFNLLLAVDDVYAMNISDGTLNMDILDNDYFGLCSRGALADFDTIPNSGLHMGSLVINTDSTFTYTPQAGKYGVDSVAYYITCGAESDTARVYVLVHKPLSLQYVACPGASVTMGFTPIAGVNYSWYNAQTGGSIVTGGTNTNTLVVVKGSAADIGTWWVQPEWKGIKFPRYQVDLLLSDYCGAIDPLGCAATGTPLYKEDFGGNGISFPRISTNPLDASLIDLNFCPTGSGTCSTYGYSIEKYSTYPTFVTNCNGGDDHTSFGNKNEGYYVYIDPAPSQMNYKLYGSVIKGLCVNAKLNFTLWAADFHSGTSTAARPKIEMLIQDAKTKDTIVTSGIFTLVRETTPKTFKYRQYGFDFTLPAGVDSIIFSIVNKEVNNIGNDWALDDIEVRLCAPEVEISKPVANDTTICKTSNVTFEGTYTDDGTFTNTGDNLVYRWEYSTTGDISTPTDWSVITGTQQTGTGVTISSSISLSNVQLSDEGYYRLVVGNTSTIGQYNCRAMSRVIRLNVYNAPAAYPDVRVQICPGTGTINLSKYIDTTDFRSINWTKIAGPAINSTTGIIDATHLVYPKIYAYTFDVTNACATISGKLYVRTIKDRIITDRPDTVVVCYEHAASLHLNQMFGIDAQGQFDADAAVKAHITEAVAPAIYAGATIFDGKTAYGSLNATYNYTYNGVASKKVEIKYKSANGSCLNGYEHKIVVILTSKVIP